MPKITYVAHDGTEYPVEVSVGHSLMEGALNSGVPGIEADCGGACACATCHIFIDIPWAAITGEPEEMETSMLEFVGTVEDSSRLSCQVRVTEQCDGLIVRLPEKQH